MNKVEWFKCSEGLPSESGNYLLCADGYVFEVSYASFAKDGECFSIPFSRYYSCYDFNATHWAYLPEPPETN